MAAHYLSSKVFQRLPLIFVLILSSVNIHAAKEPENSQPLILAIHPYLNPQDLLERFAPLAQYLSKEISQKVVVRIGRSYEEHLQALCHDEVDIAFLGPAPYVKLSSRSKSVNLLAKLSCHP